MWYFIDNATDKSVVESDSTKPITTLLAAISAESNVNVPVLTVVAVADIDDTEAQVVPPEKSP